MARTIIKSNSTDRTKRQRLAHDQNINTKMPKPRMNAPGNSRAGTETAKKSPNGSMQMAPPKKAAVKKDVKKAVKKTATAAKKTVKRAVAAVKKVAKKRVGYNVDRAADAGRKPSLYTKR
jgi:DNA-directed RNA polymerase sigma subunit (sigma70/sigma32)